MRTFLLLAGLLPAAAVAQAPLQSAAPGAATAPAPVVASVSPTNPYEAVVPLIDASPAAEAAALREALALVLAGITGLSDVRTSAAAAPILEQASKLAQRYGDEQDPVTHALLYRAAFDPRSVEEAVKRQGLPVFGVVAGAEQEWPVDVSAVNTFRDYGRALSTLRKLRSVKGVQVRAVQADHVQMLIRFEGDAQALSRAIAGSGKFVPALGAAGLQFALQPGS